MTHKTLAMIRCSREGMTEKPHRSVLRLLEDEYYDKMHCLLIKGERLASPLETLNSGLEHDLPVVIKERYGPDHIDFSVEVATVEEVGHKPMGTIRDIMQSWDWASERFKGLHKEDFTRPS